MEKEDLVKLIRRHQVSGISCNSKSVKRGSVFIAVKGVQADGSRFIKEAVLKGAKFIVCAPEVKKKLKGGDCWVEVDDTRLAAAELAMEFYGNPANKINTVGITGTNGKTTITYLLEAILKRSGHRPGVIGTVNYRYKDIIIPAKNTTPGPLELQAIISKMVNKGIDYCIMEVSSHALSQERVAGIEFHSALFTNLTQDHLDYHKTIRSYFQAKARLFRNLSRNSFAILNADDKYFPLLKKATKARIVSYGLRKKADVKAVDIKYGLGFTEFALVYPKGKIRLKTRLIGKHNIYNILAAFAWAYQEGISLKEVKSAVEDFTCVPGRLEKIKSKKGFYVFVDYAHTEDALKNILLSLRGLSPNRIITLFGCGGERDKLKRPKMGRVADSLSDFVVITNDNPRSEKPLDIIKQIKKGIKGNNYAVIPDRKIAIKKAISLADKGDIVVIAGKGHENYQLLGKNSFHFDDREEVNKCLKYLNY